MTILEEVIMYTFQQCVYYITKVVCRGCKRRCPVNEQYTLAHTHTETEIAFRFFHFVFISVTSHLCVCVLCMRVQALYVVLPGLLDCNPFPVDSSEPCWKGGVGFPEPVRRVLQVSMCVFAILEMLIYEYQENCYFLINHPASW